MLKKCICVIPVALLALFLSSCASSPSARVLKENPALQPADGSTSPFEWTENEGDDFSVFYGDLKGAPAGGIGIYRGNNPEFHVPRNAEPIKGKLGAFDVDWYKLPNKGSKFYRTCLIDYQKARVKKGQKEFAYVTQRHVWVFADTQEGLDRVLAEAGKLKMFAHRLPDITP